MKSSNKKNCPLYENIYENSQEKHAALVFAVDPANEWRLQSKLFARDRTNFTPSFSGMEIDLNTQQVSSAYRSKCGKSCFSFQTVSYDYDLMLCSNQQI